MSEHCIHISIRIVVSAAVGIHLVDIYIVTSLIVKSDEICVRTHQTHRCFSDVNFFVVPLEVVGLCA